MDTGEIITIAIVIGSILLSTLKKKNLPANPNKPATKVPEPAPWKIPQSIIQDFDKEEIEDKKMPQLHEDFISRDKEDKPSDIALQILRQEKIDSVDYSYNYNIEEKKSTISNIPDEFASGADDIPQDTNEWRKAFIAGEILKTKF